MKNLNDRTFGLLVNPRDGGLFYAARSYHGTEVAIFDMEQTHPVINKSDSLNRTMVGRGHFHSALRLNPNNPDSDPDFAEVATGYPRVHAPLGVSRKGGGLGTVLYSALCFAAYLDHKKLVRFDTVFNKPGISSTESTRSGTADAWWKAASRKFGIASVNQFCSVTEQDFVLSSNRAKKLTAIQAAVASQLGAKSVRKLSLLSPIEGVAEVEQCEPVDVVEFSSIQKRHIPLAWLADEYDPEVIAPYRTDVSSWRGIGQAKPDPQPIVNADYSRFDQSNPKHQQIFLWIATLAKRAGASKRQLEGMRLRFSEGADIEFEPKPYVIEQARELGLWVPSGEYINTSRRSSVAQPIAPRWRPVLRGRASGAAVSPRLSEELERVYEARRALGWDVFSDV